MNYQEHISLAPHTTFKLGGPARYFVRCHTLEDIKEALVFARDKGIPFFVLGGGSNIVVDDAGFLGLVLKIELLGIEEEDEGSTVLLSAYAGESWDRFVAVAVARGLYGLENLSSIPGTVGASPIQNIGAYGAEIKDTLVYADALDQKTGDIKRFTNEECMFGYRDSFFKSEQGKDYIIVRAGFRLTKAGTCNTGYRDVEEYMNERGITGPTLNDQREAIMTIRAKKFPDLRVIGTAGSFFKNPTIDREQYEKLKERYPGLPGYEVPGGGVKIPLAWILEHVLGLKGYTKDGIGIYKNQPLVLVNEGTGTTESLMRMKEYIQKSVFDATGIIVEPEVSYIR